jgi:hypothetical protein
MRTHKHAKPASRRDCEIARAYTGGQSTPAIAAAYGLSPERVRQLLVEQGVRSRHYGVAVTAARNKAMVAARRAGQPIEELATRHGLAVGTTKEIIRLGRQPGRRS